MSFTLPAFSFEPFPGRNLSPLRLDANNNNNNAHAGVFNQASAINSAATQAAVNSSFPPLSRRGPTPTAASASASAFPSRPPPPHQQLQQFQPVTLAAAAQAAADRARLLRVKRIVTSRFRSWYRGLRAYGQWDEAREWYFMQFIRVPPRVGLFPGWVLPAADGVPGPFPALHGVTGRRRRRRGRRDGELAAGARRFVRRMVGRATRGNRRPEARDPRDVRADQLEHPVAEGFRPAGFRFRKRLGVGGQGAVFLLDMVGEDGKKIPIVAKACVGEENGRDDALAHEKSAIMCLTGAHHAVQRIVLQGLPYPTPNNNNNDSNRPKKNKKRDRLANMLQALRNIHFGDSATPPPPPPAGPPAPVPAAEPEPEPAQQASAQDEMRRARARIDNANDIILMEYMARGSVQDLIEHMVAKGTRVSDRALWVILECLFKACVAMAYPLRFAEEGKDLYNAAHRCRDEVVPPEAAYQLPKGPVVHFDLDPQNALIGDYGPPGDAHEFVPSFKVSDMGLAQLMEEAQFESELDLWQFRLCGKPQIFAPEQFTQEWEYEASIDRARLRREETAGNYQWWSNLFQVGWVMWSLITHSYPPVPPTMHSYEYPDPDDDLDLDDDDDDNMVLGFTYGAQLMEDEYGAYDASLRSLLMRLLDHNPTRRPTLAWLERALGGSARREALAAREPDEAFRKAAQRLFGEP